MLDTLAETVAPPAAKAKRARLAETLRRASAKNSAPVSFAQQRLWLLDQLEPNSALYNVPTVARLTGPLDVSALEAAINEIVARHEALRTRFKSETGSLAQVVNPRMEIKLRITDLTGSGEKEREAETQRVIREEVTHPFNLAGEESLIRAALLKIAPGEHLLVATFHHIVCDEWSLRIFFRELAAFYAAAERQEAARLPELPIQYADYAEWQRQCLKGPVLEQQLRFWKGQLEGPRAVTEISTDRPRGATPTFRGRTIARPFSPNLAEALPRFSMARQATLFMTLLAAFKTLVYRYTGLEDVIVGSPIAGRNRTETEGLIGFFVNTLLLRTSLAGNPTFDELLSRVRTVALGAYAHQDLPFEKLVDALRLERSLDHLPLTKVMFALQHRGSPMALSPRVKLEFLDVDTETAKFDITFVVQETDSGLAARVEYNCDLFEAATIWRLLEHFENLLQGVVENPARRLSELPLMGEEERRQLLVEWNDTAADYPREASIHQLFQAQAQKRPDAVAATFGGQSIAYGELNARANKLAHYLTRNRVQPGTPVAICVERSVEMLIGFLAILKAGAAYVPLDPRYPKARLEYILTDTRTPIVLAQRHLLRRLPRSAARTICLETDSPKIASEPRDNPARSVAADDVAYIIYTSGSSGQPKGVAVPHRAVNRLVLNTNYIQLGETDRVAQVSNISFDAATFEIWGALLNGGQLRGIAADVALSPRDLARELREQGITAMFLTSALFSQMAEIPGAFETVRTVIAGGEALDPKSVRAVLKQRPPMRLVNGYGPTENTTFTCCCLLSSLAGGADSVPIGRPISNTQVFILDKHLNPVPAGVPGELFTGGDGLAIGYWDRPALTAEKFILHQFSLSEAARRLYRTGDLARYLADGNIEFLGRIDGQVKIRGFRVEPGEIEVALCGHPQIRECAVVVIGKEIGQRRLAAYYAAKDKSVPNASQLRRFLTERLPEYMVPSVFNPLDALPLTENGKVDRRALAQSAGDRPQMEKNYAPPRDAVEAELAKIWENVLEIRPIGIEDRFFELGGHSLLAVRVVAEIEKAFGRKLKLAAIFQAQTIEELAPVVRNEAEDASGAARTCLVALQPQGTRPPLFFVHGAGGGMFWGYLNLSHRLGADQPVHACDSRGLETRGNFETVEEMAAQYVADLRRVQPRGPYHLGGYCFGGNVAYEMACQLHTAGEQVALLALLNCAPPNSNYFHIRCTPAWCARFIRNLFHCIHSATRWSATQRNQFLRWKWSQFKHHLARVFGSVAAEPAQGAAENLVDLESVPEAERDVWRRHIRALMSFHPRPYDGKVRLFRSAGHPLLCSFAKDYGWGELARGGVAVAVVPGAHEKILEEPWVEILASEVKRALTEVAPPDEDAGTARAPDDEHLVLVEWNRTQKDYPREKTLIQLFDEQVARTPTATALVCGARRLSYEGLQQRARRVAKALRRSGAGAETLVGICLERSEEMVAGILGTLQAGGAYVPLDPAYPKQRLAFILKDAAVPVLLTQRKLAREIPATQASVLCVEDLEAEQNADCGQVADFRPSGPANLAYVLYTSGSTGQPKGVAVEHRSAVALVCWAKDVFGAEELCGVLAGTSICFDLSIFELFVPLSWGGKVILADNAIALPTLPAAGEVRLINTVPSAIRELLRIKGVPASVQVVNLAGEALATALVDEIYRETNVAKVYDLYGPTETTTYSTFALREPGAPPSIGRPLANEQVYLLDEQLQPVPVGTAGDLYIGGAGLARAYLNRPELTAERFVPHPFKPGERLYKTGDVARWRDDGNLIFLGRADQQVKIRGFRIELGEVESVLKSHPGVRDAAVTAHEITDGDKRLAAYIVGQQEANITNEALRGTLKEKLPAYMIPASFAFLPALPLTPNGKVDRKALPVPDWDQRESAGNFITPRTPMETQLAAVWGEVLRVKSVGARDNFFDLGGHSLTAIQAVSRLREKLKVDLPLSCMLEAPTIEAFAAAVNAGRWKPITEGPPPLVCTSRTSCLQASFVQERLWVLNQLEPASDAYNIAAAARLNGKLDLDALQRSLDEIVDRHEALRTTFELIDGTLTQEPHPSLSIRITLTDIRRATRDETESRLTAWLSDETSRPFDLKGGPLIRAAFAQVDATEHAFVVVMHHTIADGWSLSILFRELEMLYRRHSTGQSVPSLPSLPVQYADFAHWQRSWMRGRALEEELIFWKRSLAGAPPELDLPADYQKPRLASPVAARQTIVVPAPVLNAAREFARREGATPFMVLMSALAITLHKWTKQTDMVLGTVVAGRNHRDVENLIGCFMNFLPLRIIFPENESGLGIFRAVRAALVDAQNHQDCPFEKIVDAVQAQRRQNRNPLYNVALIYQSFPEPSFETETLRASPLEARPSAALLDLLFEAEEKGEGLALMCEYRADLFEEATVQQLLASCGAVLQTLVQAEQTKLRDFNVRPALEDLAKAIRARANRDTIAIASTFTAEPLEEPLRYWMNELEMPVEIEFAPYNQVFQQLLDPGSVLAKNQSGLNIVLLRLEDWQRAAVSRDTAADAAPEQAVERNMREFALALEAGLARGNASFLVCICPPSKAAIADTGRLQDFERMENCLLAAIEHLNGVYVVTSRELDAFYPVAEYDEPISEELGHIPYTPVFFTALATMVARKFHALRWPRCKVIVLDCDGTLWSGVCGEDGPAGIRPNLELQQFVRRQQEAGALLCVCSKNSEEDVLAVFNARPEMLLRRDHFSAWRVNWKLKSENLRSLAQELQLGLDSFVLIDDNPVECAEVEANCPEVLTLQLPEDAAQIPNFLEHCWVFDRLKTTGEDLRRTAMYRQNRQREEFRAQAPSFEGFLAGLELRVGIAPMSQADLPRVAQLTQRTNQFNFTGRRRTESELRSLPDRFETLTVTVSDRFGDYGLVGVMIFEHAGESLAVDSFLLSCRVLGRGVEHRMLARLGEHARESAASWVDIRFDEMPRNKPARQFLESTGATFKSIDGGFTRFRFPTAVAAETEFKPSCAEAAPDRQLARESSAAVKSTQPVRKFSRCRAIALEAGDAEEIHARIEAASVLRPASGNGYLAPRTPMERQLCDLWQRLLRIERVGIQDDFFQLGGHSMLAVRLFAQLEKMTGRKFPLVTLFQAPTVERLASELTLGELASSRTVVVPLQPRGSKPPLYLVHGAGGDVLWGYANLVAHMESDQPIFALKSRGQAGLEEFASLDEMAAFYVREIRSFQPRGPYYLGGYCFGGNVAYEMARLIQSEGQTVALVALLDSAPANAGYEAVAWWRPDFGYHFVKNLCYWLQDFRNWKARDRRRFFARKARTLGRRVLRKMGLRRPTDAVDVEAVIDPGLVPEQELRLWEIHLRALAGHTQRPYAGRVTLFRTKGHPLFSSFAEDMRWGTVAVGGVTVTPVPGSHENIFMEPNVRSLARALTASLAEASGAPTSSTSSQSQHDTAQVHF